MNDPAPARDIASVWSALRRRKVVQWGLVYVAAAWGFLQGLEYVSDAFCGCVSLPAPARVLP